MDIAANPAPPAPEVAPVVMPDHKPEAPPAPAPVEEPPSQAPVEAPPEAVAPPAEPASEGRRVRKQVQRLSFDAGAEKKKLEIAKGEGLVLGEIPNVLFKVSAIHRKDDFLKKVHSLLYRTPGQFQVIKKNILAFSGFQYQGEGQKAQETEKRRSKLLTFKVEELNRLLDTLDLPRGAGEAGKKEAKVARALAFLDKPSVMSSKDLAALADKKKRKKKRQRVKATAKPGSAKARKAPKKAKKAPVSFQDDSAQSSSEEEESVEEESSEEDVPLGAMVSAPKVTDQAIKDKVKAILKTADLSVFSLKDLIKKLSEDFGADMKARKPFIKEQVSLLLKPGSS